MERGYAGVITMDADFSHDPGVLPAIADALKTHDVAIGSRYCEGGGILRWSLPRRALSRFSNFYVRFILGITIRDVTTGYVGYRAGALARILSDPPRSEGYAFLVETKYILERHGIIAKEIPIVFSERREGKSKMSWRVIWESIWMPWRLRFHS